MNRNRLTATLVAVLATIGIVLVSAPAAQAHNYYSLTSRWRTDVTRVVVSDRSGFDMDEVEAADSWNASNAGTNGIRFSYTTAACGPGTTITGPCVTIRTKQDYQMADPASSAQAVLTHYVDTVNGVPGIQSCEIHINQQVVEDLPDWGFRRATLTHELGHCLGFEHVYPGHSTFTNCDSIMTEYTDYPTTCYAPTWRDRNEFAYHY